MVDVVMVAGLNGVLNCTSKITLGVIFE